MPGAPAERREVGAGQGLATEPLPQSRPGHLGAQPQQAPPSIPGNVGAKTRGSRVGWAAVGTPSATCCVCTSLNRRCPWKRVSAARQGGTRFLLLTHTGFRGFGSLRRSACPAPDSRPARAFRALPPSLCRPLVAGPSQVPPEPRESLARPPARCVAVHGATERHLPGCFLAGAVGVEEPGSAWALHGHTAAWPPRRVLPGHAGRFGFSTGQAQP